MEVSDGDTTDIEYKLVPDYKDKKEDNMSKFEEKLADQKAKKESEVAKDPKAGEQTTLV